jgi:electron transfer flavoprotein alpha subunit
LQVLAEHSNNIISSGTLSAVTAASKLGSNVTVLVVGKDCNAAAQAASKINGVGKVIVADSSSYEHGIAENVSKLLEDIQSKHKYSHIIAASSNFGKNIAPRLAVALDVAPVSDVIAISGEDVFDRPMYAGNAIAKVKSLDPVKVMTIRPTAFEKAASDKGQATVDKWNVTEIKSSTSFIGEEKTKSERPELGAASIVVSGGRAMKSAENFNMLYELADKLGAAVGASRAAVDAGYAPNDMQVGQTGKVVAPNLYIAVGISGAIQHLAGMKDSKVIVAVNKDAEAPIFQVADFGLVDDLFKVVPELSSKVKKSM